MAPSCAICSKCCETRVVTVESADGRVRLALGGGSTMSFSALLHRRGNVVRVHVDRSGARFPDRWNTTFGLCIRRTVGVRESHRILAIAVSHLAAEALRLAFIL